MTKILGIAAAGLLAATAFGTQAQAQVACLATVGEYRAAGAGFECQDQDKIYSNWDFADADIPDSARVSVATTPTLQGDIHTVQLAAPAGQTFGNGTYNWGFTIAIDLTIEPTNVIQLVRLTNDLPAEIGVTTTKDYEGFDVADVSQIVGTLTGPGDVNEQDPIAPALGVVRMDVADTLVVAGGAANSVTNTFLQTRITIVPVPATLALFGVGLAALGVWTRRRGL